MQADSATPSNVARGTLRLGFATMFVATAALSTPVNAQNMMVRAPDTAVNGVEPEGFQLAANRPPWNHHHPTVAIATIGSSPNRVVPDSIVPTRRGPIMFAATASQIIAIVPTTAAFGPTSMGRNTLA